MSWLPAVDVDQALADITVGRSLVGGVEPESSLVSIGLLVASIIVMPVLDAARRGASQRSGASTVTPGISLDRFDAERMMFATWRGWW